MTSSTASLDQPLYGASFGQAIARFFKKYATFSGRASRSEYWWVILFLVLYFAVLGILGGILGNATRDAATAAAGQPGPGFIPIGIILLISGLAVIIPGIALTVRRLHDANLSGWLYLLTFLPSIGSLILLIMAVLPSSPLGARFDKGAAPAA